MNPCSNALKARGATSGDADEGLRGRIGVGASLIRRPGGNVRVVLDDARATSPAQWSVTGLFTSRDFPADAVGEMDPDPTELEQMGRNLLARLAAMAKVLGG